MPDSNPDVRWKQRLNSYRKAYARLRQAADLAEERTLTELEQQGLIQAFEFTHELAWKLMKDFLEARGATTPLYGSKDATREAFRTGLLTEGDDWMDMIRSRNLTSHTYNQETADEIVESILSTYMFRFGEFLTKMGALEQEA